MLSFCFCLQTWMNHWCRKGNQDWCNAIDAASGLKQVCSYPEVLDDWFFYSWFLWNAFWNHNKDRSAHPELFQDRLFFVWPSMSIELIEMLASSRSSKIASVICVSLSSKEAVNAGLVSFWPVGFNLFSYQKVLGESDFFRSFWVSIQRVLLGTGVSMFCILLAAYPLSRTSKQFPKRSIFMWRRTVW